MTRRPGFWILVLLFVGLAAWLRYAPHFRSPDGKGDPPAEATLPPFLSLEPTRVSRILVAFSIDSTRMERIDQRWWIVSPIHFPADPVAVEALLDHCRSLVPRRVVPGEPGPGDPYGVKDPMVVVEFGLHDGADVRLDFGNLSPAAGAFYLQVTGRESLAMIPEREADTYFRRPLDSWRDPSLLEFDPATVTRVELVRPEGRLTIERGGGDASWRLDDPFPGRASTMAVTEFLKSVHAMRASSFPPLIPSGRTPPARCRLLLTSAAGHDTLFLEDDPLPSARPEIGARVSGKPWRYGVPAGYRQVIRRSDLSFRDRRLLPGPPRNWRRFVVTAGPDSIEFAPDSSGVWHLLGESGTPGAPPPDRTALVDAWHRTPADSLVVSGDPLDPFRAGAPRPVREHRLAVTDTAGQVTELQLAHLAGFPEWWAARANRMDPPRSGEVFLVPAGLVLPLETILAGR